MIKFLLVLYFEDRNELLDDKEFREIADSYIEKMVEMPWIPRIGEYIDIGGNDFQVNRVEHVITERVIEVWCDVGLFDGIAAYAKDKAGWNLDALSPAGQEIFFRRLQQFMEKLENQ